MGSFGEWRARCVLAAGVALVVMSLAGCATPPERVVGRELGSFPTSGDIAPTPEAQQLLRLAEIDFKRIRAGELPMYAKFSGAPRVGRRVFKNSGYSIVDDALFLPEDDRMFHTSGLTLTLEPPITANPVSYREVRRVRRPLAL